MKRILPLTLLCFVVAAASAFSQDDDVASVRGRVTTLWGEPIETAEVAFFQLEGIQGNSPTEKLIRRATTDKNGDYKIEGLPWGQYRVDVGLFGYGHTEVWRFYLWRGAKRILDIGIPMGMLDGISQMQVRGTVKDVAGRPVNDATVTMINPYDPSKSQQVRTDATGNYDLRSMQEGDYSLYASKPGFAVASKTISIRNGDHKTSSLVLSPGGKH
jgi:protocatechuate 3,4-dioxygenase beta subunit